MKNVTLQYTCSECGRTESKWLGRCPECGSWNSFSEEVVSKKGASRSKDKVSDTNKSQVVVLSEVTQSDDFRFSSGNLEFDRVLGGGIMSEGTVLLGGEPGIGKSTLMLHILGTIQHKHVLYVSGEESLRQVHARALRIGVNLDQIHLYTNTDLDALTHLLRTKTYDVVVIDSLQTLHSSELPSAAASVNQMRMCTMELTDLAKQLGIALFLIGHITKEGNIAGPKAIEHMVDTVLYFEQATSGVRLIRAVKNRFGSVDEIGIFLMTDTGLQSVTNPIGFFLSERRSGDLPSGIAFSAVVEGSRTFIVEIQALVVPSKSGYSRVYSERIDTARVTRIAAVLERHAQIPLSDKDIYVNVGGGIKLTEVAIELPLALALFSAASSIALDHTLMSFGELSLAGEIRPVGFSERRVKGSTDLGFNTIIAPTAMKFSPDLIIRHSDTIKDAIHIVKQMNSPK
ncbi:MAG: DNA repair protein RadA [Sphaerochaetaceae bacterium]|jgi:DNA repair protein RadA/Sms